MHTLLKTAVVLGLLAPALAFAAYNDVTLTTDTVLSFNGITINISGSSATMETLVVSSTDFTVTILQNSQLTIVAPNRNQMLAVVGAGVQTTEVCTDSTSSLVLSTTNTNSITITPQVALCSTPTTAGSTGGGGGSPSLIGSSGGGGGGSVTPASTPASTPTPSATPASGLSATQVEAILSLLSSFDADAATLASVRAVLYGQASSGTGTAVSTFARNLELGMSGADVKALQVYLNTHGYAVSSFGPGSVGNETSKFGGATRAALIKFQKAVGITPAAGYFGPKTRAAAK